MVSSTAINDRCFRPVNLWLKESLENRLHINIPSQAIVLRYDPDELRVTPCRAVDPTKNARVCILKLRPVILGRFNLEESSWEDKKELYAL